ncbi:TPA: transposase [Aeromonas hydrophila]
MRSYRAICTDGCACVPNGPATARAIQSSLGRRDTLTCHLIDRRLPPDNNRVESQVRPVTLGKRTARSQAACGWSARHFGHEPGALARLNGHDLYADLLDVLECPSTQLAKPYEG